MTTLLTRCLNDFRTRDEGARAPTRLTEYSCQEIPMRFLPRPLPWFLALAGACLVLAGCGGGARVTGKLTNNGQPLTVSDKGMIVVSFIQEGSQPGQPGAYPVDLGPDGTFTVKGTNGQGIPPGKYMISVQQLDPYPTTDKLKGQFFGSKSPIVREIKGSTVLDIDLAKPQG
jgi:hypothetical protein